MQAQQSKRRSSNVAVVSTQTEITVSDGPVTPPVTSFDEGYIKIKWNVPLQRRSPTSINDKEKFVSRREIDYDRCLCKDFCGVACVNRKLNIECHADNCRFEQFRDCSNRRFTKGPKQCLEVFDTESVRGLGLRATEVIKAGDFIIQYVGEILKLSTAEGQKRYFANITDGKFYMMELENNIYIDASRLGNQARFINHSCHPNCIVERWNIHDEERVCIFASKNIRAGEELTYNYDFDYWPQAMECHCGAFHCISKRNHKRNEKDSSSKKRRKLSKGSMRSPRKTVHRSSNLTLKYRPLSITTDVSEESNLKCKCEIDIPQMYMDFIKINLDQYKEEFSVIYPQATAIQSPHKSVNVQLRAKNNDILCELHREICRLIELLQYRIVEIEKDLYEMLSPLLQTIKSESQGSISFGIGVDKPSLKPIYRIPITKIIFELYIVARRSDFERIYSYFQKQLDSLVCDYFVVPLTQIAAYTEKYQSVKKDNLIIKQEGSDAKNLLISIKGKRFEAIKAKAELTSLSQLACEEAVSTDNLKQQSGSNEENNFSEVGAPFEQKSGTEQQQENSFSESKSAEPKQEVLSEENREGEGEGDLGMSSNHQARVGSQLVQGQQ